jgi:hypothetical protein
MTKYEGKTLSKATFVLEDCFFLNCHISDSDLFYSGGDVEWVEAKFENCRFHFRGAALKTVQTLQQIGMLKVGPLPVPLPVSNAKAN